MRQFTLVGIDRVKRVAAAVGIVLALTVLGASALAAPASAQNPNPGVVPPTAKVFGKTYGEWNSRWWQWALSIPADRNPVLDETGANCAVGQSGRVWFLAGTFGASPGGGITRSCTVGPRTYLFIPIYNAFCVEEPPGGTFEQQLACAAGQLAGVSGTAVIDGRVVQDLGSYLVRSPRGFNFRLPTNNVFGAEARLYRNAAATGVYLLLEPLPVGDHVIQITNSTGVDVTYNLTVTPRGG